MEYRRQTKGCRTFLEHYWGYALLLLSMIANVFMSVVTRLLSALFSGW